MIVFILGTRPEQIKFAPIYQEMKRRGLPVHVHCTGQSPDLLDEGMLAWDSIGPEPPHTNFKAAMVWGDTRTAFKGALWAFENGIPLMHGEAGVRTYDLSSPWPEEGYRQMISRIATYHACTTEINVLNLSRDGVEVRYRTTGRTALPRTGVTGWTDLIHVRPEAILDGNVRVTGSPIVESVRGRLEGMEFKQSQPPEVLVTLHRRENRGHFRHILLAVRETAEQEIQRVTWPVHPNDFAYNERPCESSEYFQMVVPMNAKHFAQRLAGAEMVVTDSGGVQEEANALGIPCVVAREKTDRPESLGKGGAILAGTSREGVAKAIRDALAMDRTTIDRTIFGDGTASEKIVAWWEEIVG